MIKLQSLAQPFLQAANHAGHWVATSKSLRWGVAMPLALMGAVPESLNTHSVTPADGRVVASKSELHLTSTAKAATPERVYPTVTEARALRDCNLSPATVSVERGEREPVIGLDYGHAAIFGRGGVDMGAPRGPRFSTTELSVINAAARALEPELETRNVTFTRTRGFESGERFHWPHGYKESVAARGNVLFANGADVAVSLHADVRPADNSGIHIYVWRPDAPRAQPDAASHALANKMATAFRTEFGTRVSVMSQDFSLLRNFNLNCRRNAPDADCPAVLIEIGNLHNRTDVSRMTDPQWMARFTDTLATVLADEAANNENWVNDPPMQVAQLSLNCSMAA